VARPPETLYRKLLVAFALAIALALALVGLSFLYTGEK
jgi:hypothetical protein